MSATHLNKTTDMALDQQSKEVGLPTSASSDDAMDIVQLVRRLSAESKHLGHISPFEASEGGDLDPHSEKFDPKAWARQFYNTLYASDPIRVMGIAYENLHVFGYGSDTDFQTLSETGRSSFRNSPIVSWVTVARKSTSSAISKG
jgi:hypothetical protein